MTEASATAYESLIQFLYRAPIGLVQTSLDGEVTMINPMSAQWLMPLAPAGNLSNLFDVLATAAPGLRELATRPSEPGDVLCEALQFSVPGPRPKGAAPGEPPGNARMTLSLHLLRLDSGSLMACINDVTLAAQQEQQRLAMKLRDASRIDPLTGMPNRMVVLERIDHALRLAREGATRHFAVLFVNVDRFNRINVMLGRELGDKLLGAMGARLGVAVRPHDTVGRDVGPQQTAARLGGDQFVLLLDGLRAPDDVRGIAQRLCDALALPYSIEGVPVHASASIGVVICDAASEDAEAVLQRADLAMREAKRAGGGRYRLFEAGMHEGAMQRGALEDDLRRALAEGQLHVVYQPIVDLCSGGIGGTAGVEALVRWRHPTRGAVSPLDFIGIAEETGLIVPLGLFVLDTACRQLVDWQRTLGALAPRTMSVNLSRGQLLDSGIASDVLRTLEATGLAPPCLQLEVTESMAAQHQGIQARLHELKSFGVAVALDDFGTGYSSLSSLHQLPVDVVKVDRSFVSQSESSAHHRVLIEATVRVARSLGLRTVAEGIETEGQAAVLTALQCDKGQGYLYARPMPPDEATRWLAARVGQPPAIAGSRAPAARAKPRRLRPGTRPARAATGRA